MHSLSFTKENSYPISLERYLQKLLNDLLMTNLRERRRIFFVSKAFCEFFLFIGVRPLELRLDMEY